ncbi:putative lipopolysaccharide heptosyltransferase III [Hydrogenimonas sp.]
MKILVIKFRHIGDVLLTTPLLDNLKRIYPDAQVDFLINKESEPLLEGNRSVTKLHLYDRSFAKRLPLHKRIVYELKFLKQITDEHYDIVIQTTEGDRGAIIAWLTRAMTRVGIPPKNTFLKKLKPFTAEISDQPYIHTVERNLMFLKKLGHQPIHKRVILLSDEKLKKNLKEKYAILQKPYIVFHPVSRWMFKCWDEKKSAQLIDLVMDRLDLPVVLTAAPSRKELAYVDNIIAQTNHKPLNIAGKLTLQELAALIDDAKFFVGVDTAPMHMAAALDTPVLALFGPSDPVLWGPWDNETERADYNKNEIVQHNGIHSLIRYPDDEIIWRHGKKISTSMMKIEPDLVFSIIQKKIAS